MPIYELKGPSNFIEGMNQFATGLGQRYNPLNAMKYANALNWENWWDDKRNEWRPGTPLAFRIRDLISGKDVWYDSETPNQLFYSKNNPGMGTPLEKNYKKVPPGTTSTQLYGDKFVEVDGKWTKIPEEKAAEAKGGGIEEILGLLSSLGGGQRPQQPSLNSGAPKDVGMFLSGLVGGQPPSTSPMTSLAPLTGMDQNPMMAQILMSILSSAFAPQGTTQRQSMRGPLQPMARGGVAGTLRELKALEQGDSVPAVLEPGEVVVNKAAAEAIGPEKLNQLNRLFPRYDIMPKLPTFSNRIGFADGGPVGLSNRDIMRYGKTPQEQLNTLRKLVGSGQASAAEKASFEALREGGGISSVAPLSVEEQTFWNPDYTSAYNKSWDIQNKFQSGVDALQGINEDRNAKMDALLQGGKFRLLPTTEAFNVVAKHQWNRWQDIDKLSPKNTAWVPVEWTDPKYKPKSEVEKRQIDDFFSKMGGGPYLLNGNPVIAAGPNGKEYALIQNESALHKVTPPEEKKPVAVSKSADVVTDTTKKQEPATEEKELPPYEPPATEPIDWGNAGNQGAAIGGGPVAPAPAPSKLYMTDYGSAGNVDWNRVNSMAPGEAMKYLEGVANAQSLRPEMGGARGAFDKLLTQYKEQQGIGETQAATQERLSNAELNRAQAANARTVNELNQIKATIDKLSAPAQIASAKLALEKSGLENYFLKTLYTDKDYMNAAMAKPIVDNAAAWAQANYYNAMAKKALASGDTTLLRFSVSNILKSQEKIMDTTRIVAMAGKKDDQIKEFYKQYLLYKFMANPDIMVTRTPEAWAKDAQQQGGLFGIGGKAFLTPEEVKWLMTTAQNSPVNMINQFMGMSSYAGVPEDVAAAVVGE